ncbi:matrixin family metalloprotease [Pediococcus pentosaceus]|uniref:matrixin family metalloprotease n=1 Tax=Pediococcus pentosaceus TaxID=1255 RepID=UPI0018A13B62|nr:matrixin family metalloprotease [Pediococcus pentosaceus]MBF7120239.1 matrixin family metalloprotease [Pediococcus pentosaceus]MCG7196830.1 matrixin family metalloprotease [Pediococcus pentosaceus]MCI2396771.1 matrixin family metalloprotease [Pediococcus pentosaceus]
MRIRTLLTWLLLFLGATWVIKNNIVQIPDNVQQTFRNGVSRVTTNLNSILDSNWNFNQNKTSTKKNVSDDATPVESIVKNKNLSNKYYYSYQAGTPDAVQNVFKRAIATYNATGIVKIVPGAEQGWLNHLELGTYRKNVPLNQSRTIELGIGGPKIMEQTGVVSRIANHASAKLNIYYNKAVSQAVATHEVGHALGLDHSQAEDSVMYPLDREQTALSPADLAGLKSIYGETK